jgi:hypothetical protein
LHDQQLVVSNRQPTAVRGGHHHASPCWTQIIVRLIVPELLAVRHSRRLGTVLLGV